MNNTRYLALVLLLVASVALYAAGDVTTAKYDTGEVTTIDGSVPVQDSRPGNILTARAIKSVSPDTAGALTLTSGCKMIAVMATDTMYYGDSTVTSAATQLTFAANTWTYFHGTETELEALYFIPDGTAAVSLYYVQF